MSVEIREITLGRPLKEFLSVVDDVYRDDPCYVRPLDRDVADRLSPKNPFFEHAEGTIFTAHLGKTCVGRCTAQIDREHLARYDDATGFFGFLDTVDDEAVCRALLDAAGGWLRTRGMRRMRGPLSLSINEEVGCLVDGFDTPPFLLMGHHRRYQGGLIEAAGLEKVKDLFAWRYHIGELPLRARRGHAEIAALPEVTSRTVDLRHVERDIRIVMDIFNDAWSENWGFVPLTERELVKATADMKLLLIPELTRICTIDGEPAAVAIALPNVNEMIGDLHGKIFPVGIFKLLYRLKLRGPSTARLLLLGITRKWRSVRRYGALSPYLFVELHRAGEALGLEGGELSWTLEDNARVNAAIRMMGGRAYKTYRVYERSLD